MPLAELVGPGVRLAREGAPVNRQQAYILDILAPIHERMTGTRELYAPQGRHLARGRPLPLPGTGRGAGTLRRRGCRALLQRRGGARRSATSSSATAACSAPATSPPTRRSSASRSTPPFRGTEVLTNPPPSSGGILISYCLGLLERLGPRSGPEQLVAAMEAANSRRDLAFAESLYEEGMEIGFLDPAGLDLAAADLLGSTTHISVLDADGNCASVTCSNGSGSGVLVPGTGVILNNMLGEEDLNPLGFHLIAPGRRVPSMMAPTRGPARRRDRPRPRQRRLQPDPLGDPADGGAGGRAGLPGRRRRSRRRACTSSRASSRPSRGSTPTALDRIEARGVARWPAGPRSTSSSAASRRSPAIRATGELSGGGDPRRGGAVAYAD